LGSLLDMNRTEKEQYVIRLYKENKSTREIAKIMHMSFRNIGAITKKVKLEADRGRDQLEEDEDIKSKSKTTQAIKLFSELNTPVEVAVALDLPADQVQEIYQEYWELEGMSRLAQIYDEAKYDLHDLLRLHRIVKGLGMEKRDIISVFGLIKHNQLEALQWKARYLRSEINRLEWKNRDLERTIIEYEETLAQKRAEMAYLNRESIKSRRRIVEYITNNLQPITHSEPDTNSHSTRIVPYNKE
jgi:transcriptional regulator